MMFPETAVRSFRRVPIGLGDAVRAMNALDVVDHARALKTLGLHLTSSEEASTTTSAAVDFMDVGSPPIVPRDEGLDNQSNGPTLVRNDALVMRPAAAKTAPTWYSEIDPLKSEEPSIEAVAATIEPLFAPAWQRSVLLEALSGKAPSTEIVVDAIVERAAALEPLSRLPVRERRSLQAGAELLIDASESMRPFFGDEEHIIDALRRLFPSERLTIVVCRDGPNTIARDGDTAVPCAAPPAGVAVLILSNFGIAGHLGVLSGGDAGSWSRFCTKLRHAGHRVTAFVPADTRLMPRLLHRSLAIVPWDRGTSSGHVAYAQAALRGMPH